MSETGIRLEEYESDEVDNEEVTTTPAVGVEPPEEEIRIDIAIVEVTNFPPKIDHNSASNDINGIVYIAYAFPRTERASNYERPDYHDDAGPTFSATVVDWDRRTGDGFVYIDDQRLLVHISIEDIAPKYGALIVGTQVMFQQRPGIEFDRFWVNHDRYYILYREAAICERHFWYMRERNHDLGIDIDLDYFGTH